MSRRVGRIRLDPAIELSLRCPLIRFGSLQTSHNSRTPKKIKRTDTLSRLGIDVLSNSADIDLEVMSAYQLFNENLQQAYRLPIHLLCLTSLRVFSDYFALRLDLLVYSKAFRVFALQSGRPEENGLPGFSFGPLLRKIEPLDTQNDPSS